jgi:hypothetical protein
MKFENSSKIVIFLKKYGKIGLNREKIGIK